MTKWTEADIPDQTGRTVLVTGANSGLGLRSAELLASRGARVLMACRDPERGRAAVDRVRAVSSTDPELVTLDLADLASVRKAAESVRELTGDTLDVVMNNAGIMAVPHRTTADGFELQVGTNHLGHAGLTWLLMPALRSRPGARVVTLSSIAHLGGNLDVADLNFGSRSYTPAKGYTQSKLANLMFAVELDRRVQAAGLDLVSVAAHPGMSETELPGNSIRMRTTSSVVDKLTRLGNKVVTQPVERGVLPQLYAATAPGVRGGEYYGPNGFRELRGWPALAKKLRAASDERTGRALWSVTADLTGIDPDPA
ncbi:SDR family NAD(P)-dependent oxidoreductase [Allosaccharopolyspora coralli]|uniref:SDR family NAD(P)-dependent oxidoreductase n=1 Tax=Allosaccharopolyspora coralli TaxID=2665642 RepID=A0A5Q3Q862_9PSEU|nr:oxidoreductase [Allosaccharopolyspora coralli]QGK69384.1 SDR family NAD(P)-dependent oxidoreductase [Allosaccharopolyspora coralli]